VHLGNYNENSEKLIENGRIIVSTIVAGATGAYLRIALNLDDIKKLDGNESTFICLTQVVCGGLVGLFIYVVAESKMLLKILYVGDITVTLDWEGSVALSLLAGLLAKQIISGVLRERTLAGPFPNSTS
jgi:hypothetical protein